MIGKYRMMRRTYLEESQPMKYAQLLRAGTLTDHLEQVNEEAKSLLETQMERLEKAYPAPNRRNQLEWVRKMYGGRSHKTRDHLCPIIKYYSKFHL